LQNVENALATLKVLKRLAVTAGGLGLTAAAARRRVPSASPVQTEPMSFVSQITGPARPTARSFKRARPSAPSFGGELLQKDFFIDDAQVLQLGDWQNAVVPWRDASAEDGAGTTRIVLSSISGGSTKETRTGNQINVHKIQFRIGFRLLDGLTSVTADDILTNVKVRVLLVLWESTNQLSIDGLADDQIIDNTNADDHLGHSAVMGFRNTDNTRNYSVLYDKTRLVTLDGGQPINGTNTSVKSGEAMFAKDIDVPAKLQNIRYKDANQTIGSHVQRSICMYYFIDNNVLTQNGIVSTWACRGNARVRYTA